MPSAGAAIVSEIVELVKVKPPVPVLLSAPDTVKVKGPAAVGTPETTPALLSDRPAGKAPLASAVENV
jgi:hypothetical protein